MLVCTRKCDYFRVNKMLWLKLSRSVNHCNLQQTVIPVASYLTQKFHTQKIPGLIPSDTHVVSIVAQTVYGAQTVSSIPACRE